MEPAAHSGMSALVRWLSGGGPGSQEPLTALTTEHFSLQSARSQTASGQVK